MHTDSTHVKRGSKAAQSEATRAKLVKVARRLFARRGYSAVGTEEIVQKAGLTRGALYHQFEDKKALFRAVFEQVESEVTQRILSEAGAVASDPVEELRTGTRLWLDASLDPEVRRIVLLDAPAVLGFEEWRQVVARYGLGVLAAGLEAAMETGVIDRQPVTALAHVLMGALDAAALYVAESDDPQAARKDMEPVLGRLVESLRT
ncbi:MAG TPA: TetR/AcrR family transcriptional regulator [Thermoleophilaceae bacterium]|nr:TetR/AcrR family transcriptional regulator [Thermoleophilaceae bacterium]